MPVKLKAKKEKTRPNSGSKAGPNPLFFIIPALAAVILLLFAIYSIRTQANLKQRRELDQKISQINQEIAMYEDILKRHPDFYPQSKRSYIEAFKTRPAGAQIERLAELTATRLKFAAEMRAIAIRKTTDVKIDPLLPEYRTYSPEGFRLLNDSAVFPNTFRLTASPPITGNSDADRRIISIAESRGYSLRPQADQEILVKADNKRLIPGVAQAWEKLKAAAAQEGIKLGLISGYRAVDYQRRIFLRLLEIEAVKRIGRTYSPVEIGSGRADEIIDSILRESSIPGYSKHHTGYVIDITELSSGKHFTEFGETEGFRWISALNYLNAKKYGFIPSYPEGAKAQGPQPEAWEYVFVGEKNLKTDIAAPNSPPVVDNRIRPN